MSSSAAASRRCRRNCRICTMPNTSATTTATPPSTCASCESAARSMRSGRFPLLDRLSESDEVAIRREHQEFALAVGFVGGAMHVAGREAVECRLEFGVQRIDVAHVDVIAEAPVARQHRVALARFEDADAAAL